MVSKAFCNGLLMDSITADITKKKEINLLSVRALRNGQLFKAHAWLQNCIMYESLSDAEIISWHCKMNKQRQKS